MTTPPWRDSPSEFLPYTTTLNRLSYAVSGCACESLPHMSHVCWDSQSRNLKTTCWCQPGVRLSACGAQRQSLICHVRTWGWLNYESCFTILQYHLADAFVQGDVQHKEEFRLDLSSLSLSRSDLIRLLCHCTFPYFLGFSCLLLLLLPFFACFSSPICTIIE